MSNDIAFRRIRGRIVPIKLSKKDSEGLKGAGIAAAGAAVAVGGGSAYKRLVTKSAGIANKAFEALTPTPKQFSGIKNKFRSTAQMTFDDFVVPKIDQSKGFKAAKKLSALSGFVRKASPVIGGALMAYGATKIAQSRTEKKLDPEKAAVLGALGAGSLPMAIKQGEKLFNVGLQSRQAKFAFASSGIKNMASKYGSRIFKGLF